MNLVFLTRCPTILCHVASRTDAASTDHRLDHGYQAVVSPAGPDAGHSRATGRGTSDPRREDHRARQDKEVHPGPGTLSGLRFCFSRPQASNEPKPLPAMSKRRYRSTALWHRFSRMLKKSASGVLTSLRGSTYRSVRLASSLVAALLDSLFEHPSVIVALVPSVIFQR